jgi:hypothetical protein
MGPAGSDLVAFVGVVFPEKGAHVVEERLGDLGRHFNRLIQHDPKRGEIARDYETVKCSHEAQRGLLSLEER